MAAIGFIETQGLVAAIEAADAMLKAADVRMLERTQVGSGLVTITVTGEVSAVQAAVDAAEATVKRIEGATLVSKHVIARPDEGISSIIATEPVKAAPKVEEPMETAPVEEPAEVTPIMEAQAEAPVEEAKTEETPAEEDAAEEPAASVARHSISQMKKMKVASLRQIARSLTGLSMTHEEIKKANKKSLIESIANAYKNIEE
ncbi:BMC domain-containing protein [Pseudodesulfovibrio sp. zrk46]|uniref:BMC domain-containing protein n=1 Tax=Pseudodesulfovibrio sp. zrk46 TaxID=2725288 RepID=UPI001449F4A2|nr:BMC domain-containing protein [Pseudodesulfovibrio sp. zrk46]